MLLVVCLVLSGSCEHCWLFVHCCLEVVNVVGCLFSVVWKL